MVTTSSSDFDVDGVSIINLALDRYSQKKARTEKFTDSELIVKELTEQSNTPNSKKPNTSYSGDGGSSFNEAEASTRSYGAMLRSYARKTSAPPPPSTGSMKQTVEEGVVNRAQVNGVGPLEEAAGQNGNFAMALSMDYEIVTPEGSLVESVKVEHVS